MNWTLTFTTLLLVGAVAAIPTPTTFTGWLHGALLPPAGATLAEEIKCYNLPCGGIGFMSHVLTYYTAVMIMLGKTPLLPRPGENLKHSRLDILLGALTLIVSVPIAAMTMDACRNRWQYVLIGKIAILPSSVFSNAEHHIAFWKLFLSFTLSAISIHTSDEIRRKGKIDLNALPVTLVWTLFYFLGTIVGLVGVLSLNVQLFSESRPIRVISAIFIVLAGCPRFASWHSWLFRRCEIVQNGC